MLNLRMPLEDVSKMLGYKSIRTTQRYAKVRSKRIQDNFNKFVRPQINLTADMIISIKEKSNSQSGNNLATALDNITTTMGSSFTYKYIISA